MKKEFKYKLIDAISVDIDGKTKESKEVVMRSPRPKDKIEVLKLETFLTKAVMGFTGDASVQKTPTPVPQSDEKVSEEEKVKGFETLIFSQLDYKDIEIIEITFNNILCSGNGESPQATVGGAKFTKPLCEEIGYKDFKALIARFAVHFLFSDLM